MGRGRIWEEVEAVVPRVLYRHLPDVFDGNHESLNRDRWCLDQWFPFCGPRTHGKQQVYSKSVTNSWNFAQVLFLQPVLSLFCCILLLLLWWIECELTYSGFVITIIFCHRVFSGIMEPIGITMGNAVAQLFEVLRCKPGGRGFHSQWCRWNFSLT